jgi:two-component system sensor histidine kinase PilS (NtrC family)
VTKASANLKPVKSAPWRSITAKASVLRPEYDGPVNWLWFVGGARILVLLIVATGAHLIEGGVQFSYLLTSIYVGAVISSVWYLLTLRHAGSISPTLTWTQLLVDFSVVAATISFTGGHSSLFNFLLVIVILEAGVMLGLMQGFVFATLAMLFMFAQTLPATDAATSPVLVWYNFLVQAIAFYFVALISGYWNQRVSRMKQFQRDILDNMNSGFLIADEKGLVLAINHAACRILGLEEANVIGLHVDGILRPDSGAECPVTTALRSGRDFTSYEFHVETASGEPLLLGLTTNRMEDRQGGHVTAMIASFTDLTEMARMRHELQQQDRLAVVGELAAGLAHEIRNPLAALRGATDELRRSTDNPQLIDRLVGIALRESDHLNDIVTAFLDFARNPIRKREIVDVCALLREVEDLLRDKFGAARELTISMQLPEKPCTVVGDPTQLRQVFLNIGQNGIEAMNARGRLEIILDAGRGPVEVRFEDQGPGIPPDKMARIFEPFYTEKDRGVGMGLAVCMRIITAHDGTIHAAARQGGGAAISVRLPARADGAVPHDDGEMNHDQRN